MRHTRTGDSYLTNLYDNIRQLKTAGAYTSGGSAISGETKGYLYDTARNLNKRTNNSTGSTTTFLVDGKNQLTNVAGSTYTYDSNGNLTGPGSLVYDYDAENQLKSVTLPSTQKTDFVYDGRARLRKRVESIWTNSTWQATSETRYIYDGMRVIQERNSGNTPTVSYTRGADLSGSMEGAGGIGGLLARSHGYSGGSWGTHNYYHADGGGNITMLIDGSQVTVASYRYDSYGNTISSSGGLAATNVYRFSSKEVIVNWGLYYYGYRFYDPNLQKWPNRDPLGEYGGLNLYAFVRNGPLNAYDPFGLSLGDGSFGGGIGGPLIKFCQAAKDRTCGNAAGANVLLQLRLNGIDGNDDVGGGNAFRHCLAACQTAKTCGDDSAKRFWNGREDPSTAAGRQDLANNAVGFGNASQSSCWNACMNSWNSGGLTCANGPCPPRPPPPPPPPPLPYFPPF